MVWIKLQALCNQVLADRKQKNDEVETCQDQVITHQEEAITHLTLTIPAALPPLPPFLSKGDSIIDLL
jgi:hypothetical protein